MEYDCRLSAEYASAKLDKLVNRVHRDTLALVEQADIPNLVRHFDAVRTEYRSLKEKIEKLEAEVNLLSYEIIPTMFSSQGVTSIKVEGTGRVTTSVRWNASMPDKQAGMDWLRSTGNDGLIIETVNAGTLSAFAKSSALEGKPLPSDLFNVGQLTYTSITKS